MDIESLTIIWYPIAFVLGWQLTARGINAASSSFIQAGLKGNDMGRADRPEVNFSLYKIRLNYIFIRYPNRWV